MLELHGVADRLGNLSMLSMVNYLTGIQLSAWQFISQGAE
jgi:hypothetical protein